MGRSKSPELTKEQLDEQRKFWKQEAVTWKEVAQYFEYVGRNKKDGEHYDYEHCAKLNKIIENAKSRFWGLK